MGTAILIGVLVVVVLLVGGVIVLYNRLVRLKNQVEAAWGQIDVQLTRRYDLIPNLVETAKGYASHERATLERVTALRTEALSATNPAEKAAADDALTGALKSLFAVAEAYPDLKANQNFLQLQEELAATESRVAYARQYYNDVVARYNSDIRVFPTVLIASMLGFQPQPFFEATGDERAAVQVKFS